MNTKIAVKTVATTISSAGLIVRMSRAIALHLRTPKKPQSTAPITCRRLAADDGTFDSAARAAEPKVSPALDFADRRGDGCESNRLGI